MLEDCFVEENETEEKLTLGLRDEEVGVDKAACAEGAPDEEDLSTQVTLVAVNHVGTKKWC
jgi:hypothetical protein